MSGSPAMTSSPVDEESVPPVLELHDVRKGFPGVQALKGVGFTVRAGEVHCLVGENGAGKSTLIKILAGAHEPDAGQVVVNGAPVRIDSARKSRAHGLAFIFQELDVVETLSVADNVTLGHEPNRVWWARGDIRRRVSEALAAVGLSVDPATPMRRLSIAQRQLALIARALVMEAQVIVMDEPSATLTEAECERLFEIIEDQRSRGIAVIYVSHRLDEVFRLANRISVLRDGALVDTVDPAATTRDAVIRLMIGRPLESLITRPQRHRGEEVLRVTGLSGAGGRVREVSMSVHRGEVFGLAGLVGSGRTELVRMIFGADPIEDGSIHLRGSVFHPKSPRDAIKERMGLVPEERKAQGIVGALTVRENISMVAGARVSRLGLVRRRADRELAREYVEKLHIRTPTSERSVSVLSGGNQQKVVIAKWLASEADLLVLDEPTRGVDVGAKSEIFDIVNQLAAAGTAIIMISSELEEVVAFCDRVAVMRAGRLTTVLHGEGLTIDTVMAYAT